MVTSEGMRRLIRPGEPLTEVVARAVADETGRDIVDLDPLQEAIDTDALNTMFMRSSADNDGLQLMTLLYEGCRVTIEEDVVTVEEVPGISSR